MSAIIRGEGGTPFYTLQQAWGVMVNYTAYSNMRGGMPFLSISPAGLLRWHTHARILAGAPCSLCALRFAPDEAFYAREAPERSVLRGVVLKLHGHCLARIEGWLEAHYCEDGT